MTVQEAYVRLTRAFPTGPLLLQMQVWRHDTRPEPECGWRVYHQPGDGWPVINEEDSSLRTLVERVLALAALGPASRALPDPDHPVSPQGVVT